MTEVATGLELSNKAQQESNLHSPVWETGLTSDKRPTVALLTHETTAWKTHSFHHDWHVLLPLVLVFLADHGCEID